MQLQVGIGTSQTLDSQTAGKEAIQLALQQINTTSPNLLIVFANSNFNHQELLNGITQICHAPLIGTSTAGEITKQGHNTNSVTVIALASSSIHFSIGIGENLSTNEIKSAEHAAKTALDNCQQPDMRKTFIMFSDALHNNQIATLQGIQNILGEKFEIIGATSSDNTRFQQTFQYFNEKVYQNSVVGTLIAGDIVTGIGLSSGWQSLGNQMKCTKAENNTIYEFDGKPALEVYKTYLGPERSAKLPAIAFEYPFGILPSSKRKSEQPIFLPLRAPIAINQTNNSLTFAAPILQNTTLTLTAAYRQNILQKTKTATQQAKQNLTGAKPLFALNFTSIGLPLVLGPRINEQTKDIVQIIDPDTPFAGFVTYGEIGPLNQNNPDLNTSQFHNQSNLVWILGTNIFQT